MSSSRCIVAGTLMLAVLSACSPAPAGHTPAAPQTVTVDVAPPSAQVQVGGSARFAAAVTGTVDTAVLWDVAEAGGGSVDASGLYTAPATVGVFHVRARSHAAPGVQSESTVSVVATPVVTVTISPRTPSVVAGGTVAFTAVVANASNTAVTWSVPGTGCGTITQAGVYSAPPAAAVCTVVATSQQDPSKSDWATVTVTALPPPVTVTISPRTPSVVAGGTVAFTAVVANASNTAVTWSVPGAGCGTITQAGVYSAPPTAAVCSVAATSQQDPSKSDAATVTVTALPPPVIVTITPSPAAADSCGTVTFSATVTGTSNTSVTWSVQEGTAGGTITSAGVYTAPSNAGTYHVAATSAADTSKSAVATVTVSDRILSVAVNPATIQVAPGGSTQFTATVTTTCGTSTATSSVAVTASGEVVVQ